MEFLFDEWSVMEELCMSHRLRMIYDKALLEEILGPISAVAKMHGYILFPKMDPLGNISIQAQSWDVYKSSKEYLVQCISDEINKLGMWCIVERKLTSNYTLIVHGKGITTYVIFYD